MWTLLLLAATVQSFAHMPLGISDRNSTYRRYGNQLVMLNENMLDVICQQRQNINYFAIKHQQTKKCDKPPLDFEIWYFPINFLVEKS